MKVFERVLEQRVRGQAAINSMQFGFMPGKGTTDAIFVVRQLQEKHMQKKKALFYQRFLSYGPSVGWPVGHLKEN